MPALPSTLRQLSDAFALRLLDALRGASLEEILATSPVSAKGKSNGARGGAAVQRPTRSPSAKPASEKRTPEQVKKTVSEIAAFLKTHPKGVSSEGIQKGMGLGKKAVALPLVKGVAAGVLKKRGVKRATVYFAE